MGMSEILRYKIFNIYEFVIGQLSREIRQMGSSIRNFRQKYCLGKIYL